MTAERIVGEKIVEPKVGVLYEGQISKVGEIIEVQAKNSKANEGETVKLSLNPDSEVTPLYNFLNNHISKNIKFIFLPRRANNKPGVFSLSVEIFEVGQKNAIDWQYYEKVEYYLNG